MNQINLTPAMEKTLAEPIALAEATLIGSSCDNCVGDGVILIIPVSEIISMRRGLDIDELNDLQGNDIIELIVNTTEGEQTYYLYDFVVVD